MLAIKLAGVVDIEASHELLHVSAFIQTADARHLASGRTGDATRNQTAAVWNEEVLLPISNEEAPSASSLLLELRGSAAVADDSNLGGASEGIVGFATVEWSEIKSHAADQGWATELRLLSASGQPLGAKLFARLLLSDAAAASKHMKELKQNLSDAMTTVAREKAATNSAFEAQERMLANMRAQLGLKLRQGTSKMECVQGC